MSIKLAEIKEKNIRNDFVINNFKFYSFLNSRERGEFQKLEGNKIFRLGIFKNIEELNNGGIEEIYNMEEWRNGGMEKGIKSNTIIPQYLNPSIPQSINNVSIPEGKNIKLIGLLLLIKFQAKRGTYFLCPHGPLIKENYFQVFKEILPELKKLCKQENASFIRFCPQIDNTFENLKNFEDMGFKFAPMHAHAEETHLLDLSLSEEKLKENMRKTTRYIVNRAEKEGVKIILDSSEENIERFIGMHHKHAHRTNGKLNYSAFSSRYIYNLYKAFDSTQITTMNAVYNDEIEASLVTLRFGKTCVYYLGASEIKNPKFSPAYYLQWEAIRKAKSESCLLYNFWGVSPDENPKHPLHGVSLFKRGFGGYDFNLIHAQDFVVSRKYWINYIVEKFRSWRRGYYFVRPKAVGTTD